MNPVLPPNAFKLNSFPMEDIADDGAATSATTTTTTTSTTPTFDLDEYSAKLSSMFPPDWAVKATSKGKFTITDPSGEHKFKAIKAAKTYLETGNLPESKPAVSPAKAASKYSASSSAASLTIQQIMAKSHTIRTHSQTEEATRESIAAQFPAATTLTVEFNRNDGSSLIVDESKHLGFMSLQEASDFYNDNIKSNNSDLSLHAAWRAAATRSIDTLTLAEVEAIEEYESKTASSKKNREQNVLAQFPEGWTAHAKSNGSYTIRDPENLYTFKTVKDARNFIDNGVAPPAKLTKKEQAKADAAKRAAEKAKAKADAAAAAEEARGKELVDEMKAQFPDDWVIERSVKGHWKFTEPSEAKSTFKTIKDAKNFLENGVLPLSKSELAAIAAAEAEKTANDAKALELAADFPPTWTITVPKKGIFKFQEPAGVHIFRSLKDAKIFLETGVVSNKRNTLKGPNAVSSGDDSTVNSLLSSTSDPLSRPPRKAPTRSKPPSTIPDSAVVFADPFSLAAVTEAYKFMERDVPLSDADYTSLNALMLDLCKSPAVENFIEDVLEPTEGVILEWSKFVNQRVNLSQVCRKLRSKEYKTKEQFQVDMYRMFYNCTKYHTTNTSRQTWQDLISMVKHCRNFFDALWLEHMVPPSPLIIGSSPAAAFASEFDFKKRDALRSKRVVALNDVKVSKVSCGKFAEQIRDLLSGTEAIDAGAKKLLEALVLKYDALRKADAKARPTFGDVVNDSTSITKEQYSLYDVVQSILGRLSAPIFEFVSRGDATSSCWAVPFKVVWARENAKKPYFPATVIGILPDVEEKEDDNNDSLSMDVSMGDASKDDMDMDMDIDMGMGMDMDGEDANDAAGEAEVARQNALPAAAPPTPIQVELTRSNEERLHGAIKSALIGNRKRAIKTMRESKNTQRCILVEFTSSHEFMYVRSNDTIPFTTEFENPNYEVVGGLKKKKSFKGNDLAGEKYTEVMKLVKATLDELDYRADDTCGDALMSDVEDDEEDDDLPNVVVWGKSVPKFEFTVPAPKLTADEEEDKEFADLKDYELLLATHGVYDLYEQAVSSNFVTLYGKPKIKKRKALSKSDSTASDSAKKPVVKRQKKEVESNPYARGAFVSDKELMSAIESDVADQVNQMQTDGGKIDILSIPIKTGEQIMNKKDRAVAKIKAYVEHLAEQQAGKTKLKMSGLELFVDVKTPQDGGLVGLALGMLASVGAVKTAKEEYAVELEPWKILESEVKGEKKAAKREALLEKQVKIVQREIDILMKRQEALIAGNNKRKLADAADGDGDGDGGEQGGDEDGRANKRTRVDAQ
jgi:hypothetical protein